MTAPATKTNRALNRADNTPVAAPSTNMLNCIGNKTSPAIAMLAPNPYPVDTGAWI